MSAMQEVNLRDFMYMCAVYVMRRTEYTGTLDSFLQECMQPYTTAVRLRPGDIVMWYKNVCHVELHCHIKLGVVHSHTYRMGMHYAVYEGAGIVSDAVWDEASHNPMIRMRTLDELPAPNYTILNTWRHNDASA